MLWASELSIPLVEVRPRNAHRGVDLISDALPFGRVWCRCRLRGEATLTGASDSGRI